MKFISVLFRCPKNSSIGNAFYDKSVNKFPNVKQLLFTEFIIEWQFINMEFIKFISSCQF